MEYGGFRWLDCSILIAYIVGLSIIGARLSRRQTSTKEFYVAGKRMHWLPVAFSVVASVTSGITLIGQPARAYQYDAVYIVWPLATALATPIIIFALVPFYRRLNVVSAYEYLEKRFNLNVRLLASALFIFKRLLWMALVALAPSLVLSVFVDIPVEYCILIIGAGATIYTGLGGMSAVLLIDSIHFIIMLGGMVLVVCSVAWRVDGGFAEIWRVGYMDHKAWMSMEFHWGQLTFWTLLVAGVAIVLSDLGADQMTVQRLMTTRDERTTRISLIFNVILKAPLMFLIVAMGVCLWVFYKYHPEALQLPPKEMNKIMPYYVVTQLPQGVSGLVIAAIFAAAMSSFDSGLNCIVTAFMVDWYERIFKPGQEDRKYLGLAKKLTYVTGGLVTALAIGVYEIGIKNIADAAAEYGGLFSGGLLGIFMLGVFTRRAKALPTVLGAIISVVVLVGLYNYQSEEKGYWINPWLYTAVGCILTMLIGYFGSLWGPAPPYETIREYTLVGGLSSSSAVVDDPT